MPFENLDAADAHEALAAYEALRAMSLSLAAPLTDEDWMLQSMPDASPVKWNLAHVSWFFETFLLKPHLPGYEEFHPQFNYLFNSYYNLVGRMYPRPERGLLSRPTAREVRKYRDHVDAAMHRLLETATEQTLCAVIPLVALGVAHEQQHQELLLTDLKHGMHQNPLRPVVYEARERSDTAPGLAPAQGWVRFEGGLQSFGAESGVFAFDNEGPRHQSWIAPFMLAARPVTNTEFLEFIADGGYLRPELWLADGWARVSAERLRAPLYWRESNGEWLCYTLSGERPLDLAAPVAHISYYEAAAYAEWTGYRLPTEHEWEHASAGVPVEGRFLTAAGFDEPRAAQGEGLLQMFGDVWEWTASPYVAYPGYRTPEGAIGEYNGKFMSSQMVLRGGSCATPEGHIRRTYRNFFPPHARWQFAGLRLARDV